MKIRYLVALTMVLVFLLLSVSTSMADEKKTILFHIKTSLKRDDSQVCVAYNMIWTAVEEGLKVNVLIDADATNTYKIGWFGRDGIENYPLPLRLRKSLSEQFKVDLKDVPENYGRFLDMLHDKGVNFYINSAFLVLAKIEKEAGFVEHVSAKFFKPVTLKEMLELRMRADYYMVY